MNLKEFSLKNKTALITGAGGLLGCEHAYAILEAGGSVVITDVSLNKLNKNFKRLSKNFDGKKIWKFYMDVRSEKSINSCLRVIKKQKMFIDILINNASINPKYSKIQNLKKNNNRLENFKINQWNKEISVGLTGAFLCSKIFGNEMANSKRGIILNISSDLSIIAPDQRLYKKRKLKNHKQPVKPITYSVIKTGLIGLTKYLATYWAQSGVRCNSISPGSIFDNQNKIFVKNLNKLIPLGRMAKKNEYRSAIQFLCSNASSYMTGQNLVIDGGRTIW